jgi:hypothetical protein
MLLTAARKLAILDFDCESVATGFGDPQWVPQKVTAIAWSWFGDERIESRLRLAGAEKMLTAFLKAYNAAELIVGHYIRKHDLPLIDKECAELGLPPLAPKLVQDTHADLIRTKGMKRDQDNLAEFLELAEKKQTMNQRQWEAAYAERGWPQIRARAESDVRQNKLMREAMLERGWLKPPRIWRP